MNALVVFAKYPEPGKVKTRLAKSIGNEKAAEMYKLILENTIKGHLKKSYKLVIAYTPDEARVAFEHHFPGVELIPQSGNNLGQRMQTVFKTSKYEKTIIIGSDVPNIGEQDITQGFVALDSVEIVLGPSFDGSFWLIGMKKFYPIFDDLSWSSPKVLEQTIENIKKIPLGFKLVDLKRDIDTVEDLREYGYDP